MNDQNSYSNTTQNRTVLVVDDEQELADLYANWLEDCFTVHTAYNGSDAIESIDQNVDVVLLDRRMPDMSGDDVLTEIRNRSLPCRVAMVTAAEPDIDVIEMGFDDYITKPVFEGQLREIVESLLSRRRYDDRVQELFSLLSKRHVLEAEKSNSDLATHKEYTSLLDNIDDLQSTLDKSIQSFEEADFRASILTLESMHLDRESKERDQQNQTNREDLPENIE